MSADALRAVVAGDADKAAGAVDLSAMDWEARTAFLDELFT